MQDALDRVDFKALKTLGHQMRGSGGMYGFQAITDIGAALEQAAESVDVDTSRKWVGELSSYLDRVEPFPEPQDSRTVVQLFLPRALGSCFPVTNLITRK